MYIERVFRIEVTDLGDSNARLNTLKNSLLGFVRAIAEELTDSVESENVLVFSVATGIIDSFRAGLDEALRLGQTAKQ